MPGVTCFIIVYFVQTATRVKAETEKRKEKREKENSGHFRWGCAERVADATRRES